MASAISSAVAGRPAGASAASCSRPSPKASVPSVRVRPGLTALMRTPLGPYSAVHAFDGALSPGVYYTVELHIPRKTPSVMVPAEAVVFNGDGLQVVVAENGSARFQKVTVARDFGTEVEVSEGVKPGDEVILRPMVNLADGSKVQASPMQITQK